MKYVKLLIIIGTLSSCVPSNLPPNVGTVLFSPEDLNKEQWTQNEVGALRARQFFQNLIPPPYLTGTFNDEYLVNLLKYLENCFNAIDKEADEDSEQEIMDMALSDAIGGYIKIWVLPITKYAYYGGSISSDNAIKVFQLYSNIKSDLKTDGRSWRGANEDMLKSVTIDIASGPHEWFPRSAHDACNRLAYYEKSDKGLVIPLPYINWCLNPQTMFIPLKNRSLVQLMSPNSSSALVDYYTVAASCINSQNHDHHDDFGSRFQIWLTSDVVPHLKDDNLYIAFGSVLSLLNKTKSFYKDVANFWDEKYTSLQNRAVAAGCPISWTSKKVMIIFILILIEVLWCIPALCCLWSQKRKKKKCFQFFTRKPKQQTNLPFTIKKDKHLFPGVKLFLKPKTRNLEVDVEFPSYGPKYVTVKSVKSKMNNEQCTHISEVSNRSAGGIKASKRIKPSAVSNQHTCESTPIRSILKPSKCSKSVPVLADLKSIKTMTMYQEHEIKNISYTHASISMSRSVCKCVSLNKHEDKKECKDIDEIKTEESKKYFTSYDNTKSKKDVALSAIKQSADVQPRVDISRSYVKSKSRSFKRQESDIKKISGINHDEKCSAHPIRSIKEDEPQIVTRTSKLDSTRSIKSKECTKNKSLLQSKFESTRFNKSRDCSKIQSRTTPKVSQALEQIKPNKIEDTKKISNEKATTSKNKEDKTKEARRKSRVPKLFRSKKANKGDEKEQNSSDHPKLNIKIYNTRADVSKRSDITKISKQSQELKEGQNSQEYHTLNIDIDNPQTDIEVDITSYRSKIRPSKIPRRIIFRGDRSSLNSSNPSATTPIEKQIITNTNTPSKTLKTTLDDTALPKVSRKNDRLNSTL